MTKASPHRVVDVIDDHVGLQASIVLDSVVLGPAAGGIRTAPYASLWQARADACALAAAMTLKCALAGLPAGGGKAAVITPAPALRARAFERLGRAVEDLGGQFLTAGDLGTGPDDLAAVASATSHVSTDEPALAAAAGRGIAGCAEAALRHVGGLHAAPTAAVIGCGAIGRGAALALAGAGFELQVCDLDRSRAQALCDDVGGVVIEAESAPQAAVDVLVPCAAGGLIDDAFAEACRAKVICGGANNIVARERAEAALLSRGIVVVPDVVSSAGAVIAGLAAVLPNAPRANVLIARLATTTAEILVESRESGEIATKVARGRARTVIKSS